MTQPLTERNGQIWRLKTKNGLSFDKIARTLFDKGLTSKLLTRQAVQQIYMREFYKRVKKGLNVESL